MWLPIAENVTRGGLWHVPAPKRLGQKDHEVGAGLDYIVRPCLRKRDREEEEEKEQCCVSYFPDAVTSPDRSACMVKAHFSSQLQRDFSPS